MPQYLMSVLHDSPELAPSDEIAAIDAFNDRLRADGHWVFAGGLGWPSNATVVDSRGGRPQFIDGPYAELQEHVVGFWIIEAVDLDEARALAAEGSRACNRRVELRPFLLAP